MGPLVEVPMQMRYGAEVVYVRARVVEDEQMPKLSDVLVGKKALIRPGRWGAPCGASEPQVLAHHSTLLGARSHRYVPAAPHPDRPPSQHQTATH